MPPRTDTRAEHRSHLLDALSSSTQIYDLGRELTVGMPQSPNHPAFWHALPRRHGDMVRPDGASAANDMITMGTHVGTHIDALSHVSQDGELFSGIGAAEAAVGGRFKELGAHTIAPMVRRGVLLDVPGVKGVSHLEGGYEISATDLDEALEAAGGGIGPGDVALVRSGWGRWFDEDPLTYMGKETGVPGVSTEGATWLAEAGVHAAGADTIAFECLKPGAGHSLLPAHRVLLVERGIYIIEAMNLEGIAAAGVSEFLFILSPLPLYGATGSPVRPLAVV